MEDFLVILPEPAERALQKYNKFILICTSALKLNPIMNENMIYT